MQRAIALLSIAAVLLFSGAAFASNVDSESAQYGGHIWVDASTGNVIHSEGPEGAAPAAGVDIYSNVLSTANAGISSTSLPSIWGDHLLTTGLGIVSQNDFTIYNASPSGTLTACTVAINFYNFSTSALIGGYTGSITFSTALSPGFYSIVTFINLETLSTPINLTTNDIVITQNLLTKTGAATRFGVVSIDPPTIGTSPVTMYISSATIGGGVPGYYQLAVSGVPVNTNPGYRINALSPVATEPTTWGKVKSLYR